jgi:hypothetical protein
MHLHQARQLQTSQAYSRQNCVHQIHHHESLDSLTLSQFCLLAMRLVHWNRQILQDKHQIKRRSHSRTYPRFRQLPTTNLQEPGGLYNLGELLCESPAYLNAIMEPSRVTLTCNLLVSDQHHGPLMEQQHISQQHMHISQQHMSCVLCAAHATSRS